MTIITVYTDFNDKVVAKSESIKANEYDTESISDAGLLADIVNTENIEVLSYFETEEELLSEAKRYLEEENDEREIKPFKFKKGVWAFWGRKFIGEVHLENFDEIITTEINSTESDKDDEEVYYKIGKDDGEEDVE
jgi:hypothetical protein